MPDERNVLSAFMSKLISQCGGYDAACAILQARWGHPVSKGTLTKKKAGQLDWSVTDVIALQEAAGERPVFAWFNSMADEDDELPCLMTGAADLSAEAGEAVSAVIMARTSKERAKAVKELRDVITKSDQLIDTLEAKQ